MAFATDLYLTMHDSCMKKKNTFFFNNHINKKKG